MPEAIDLEALEGAIESAKAVAMEYRRITGRPLGITGEVGEFYAAKLLGLELAEARQPGYDAVADDGRRVQIKARCIRPRARLGQPVGSIRLNHPWDTVALVLMDDAFTPLSIYEARRADIERALATPGSRARNERGALAISKFKAVAIRVWPESA